MRSQHNAENDLERHEPWQGGKLASMRSQHNAENDLRRQYHPATLRSASMRSQHNAENDGNSRPGQNFGEDWLQ